MHQLYVMLAALPVTMISDSFNILSKQFMMSFYFFTFELVVSKIKKKKNSALFSTHSNSTTTATHFSNVTMKVAEHVNEVAGDGILYSY